MVSLLVICVLLFGLNKCHCIGVEYYDDKGILDRSTQDDAEYSSLDSRRRNIAVATDNMRSSSTVQSKGNEKRQKIGETLSTTCVNDCYTNIFTSAAIKNKTTLANNNVSILSSDIMKEYEYIYDDDTNPQILRQPVQKAEQDNGTNRSENNIKVPVIEFYNIESAIQQLKFRMYSNYSENNNMWYSLESLPCWDLPVLYGEFGAKEKSCEIFLVNKGKLKNVIEKKYDNDWFSVNKPSRKPLTYYTSKWCTVEPCYGDHTLCIFSSKTLSSLCHKMYKVVVPNILEQTALVNTLNSMRNKIANGKSVRYSHLPPAANMKQVIYDYDLQKIAKVWLNQCLPGPAPCSALDGTFVTQLECTKNAKHCCVTSYKAIPTKCTPNPECFLPPVIGCLHVWFFSAGKNLTATDVKCGHTSVSTYSTAQLLWATTYKIGCAYAQDSNGDVRVVCNFSPGAPFFLHTKFYCGFIGQKDYIVIPKKINLTDTKVLMSLGINFDRVVTRKPINVSITPKSKLNEFDEDSNKKWGVDILNKIYKEGWVRDELKDFTNGTKSMIARMVVKYEFVEQNGARCDSDQPIYAIGSPGSLCLEKGTRYQGLCYDFRDPTPGYRLVAVIAPIALFSLILYDLFSGVVRQTNY